MLQVDAHGRFSTVRNWGLPDHHLFPRRKRARFATRLTRTSVVSQLLVASHVIFHFRKGKDLFSEKKG
jgi:hypothetical protein